MSRYDRDRVISIVYNPVPVRGVTRSTCVLAMITRPITPVATVLSRSAPLCTVPK